MHTHSCLFGSIHVAWAILWLERCCSQGIFVLSACTLPLWKNCSWYCLCTHVNVGEGGRFFFLVILDHYANSLNKMAEGSTGALKKNEGSFSLVVLIPKEIWSWTCFVVSLYFFRCPLFFYFSLNFLYSFFFLISVSLSLPLIFSLFF